MSKREQRSELQKAVDVALKKLLKEVMADSTASLTDKMKVIDRCIKNEAVLAKLKDDEDGAFFNPGGTDDDEQQ